MRIAALDRAHARRQPFQGPGVEGQSILRFLQTGLSALCRWAEQRLAANRRLERARPPPRRILSASDRPAPTRRRTSWRPTRKSCARRSAPMAANLVDGVRMLAADLETSTDLMRISQTDTTAFEIRPQSGDDAGQSRFPEPPAAAHPIYADDGKVRDAAAADGAAVDQQVLHPRSHPAEELHQVRRRSGLHGVRHLVGQPNGRTGRGTTFEDYMLEGILSAALRGQT